MGDDKFWAKEANKTNGTENWDSKRYEILSSALVVYLKKESIFVWVLVNVHIIKALVFCLIFFFGGSSRKTFGSAIYEIPT